MSALDLLSGAARISANTSAVSIPWLRIVLAFALCIAVAVGAIAILRMRQGQVAMPTWLIQAMPGLTGATRASAQIDIIERVALGPGHQLVLLRCDATRYLLYFGTGGACLLDQCPSKDTAKG